MTENTNNWEFWIDRGGTFTDVITKDPQGNVSVRKLLSDNPEQYDDAALAAIRQELKVPDDTPVPIHNISAVKMGTTVATNALLERKGTPTALLTTKGFADALRIGYQNRPELFALQITLPDMLFSSVLEVEERVDANGKILRPLNHQKTESDLRAAFSEGFRSIAIVFMHGYRFTDHEMEAAEIARSIGFTQISCSHQVSPLMKFIGRGDTTVADAYLTPVLKEYIATVNADLRSETGGTSLFFMQSNGDLTKAGNFRGKDAILSGPAGGVVGAVKCAASHGFDELVGFDMGGTSTDVWHYSGQYERTLETVVAGTRIRAPMMQIHTVAAGGGSILRFDGARLRVGPDSAGANPGPACYRRGGPLAVTDANLITGRIQIDQFPNIFGRDADQPLDRHTTETMFNELALQMGDDYSAEQIAEGFTQIAVQNMAQAIKKISVQRGHDITSHALVCFGGAAGQLGCQVADALGIENIFIHRHASVLSAYGMGLADIGAHREQAVEALLDTKSLENAATLLEKLTRQAAEEVVKQGISSDAIRTMRSVFLKYSGTDNAIEVPFADLGVLRSAFEEKHRSQFGFIDRSKPLIIEAVAVESIGDTNAHVNAVSTNQPLAKANPSTTVYGSLYTNGARRDVPIYHRDKLPNGCEVTGPSLIVEPLSSITIESGWTAEVRADAIILKKAIRTNSTSDAGTAANPIMLEIFNSLFMSIAEQMGYALEKTAHSVNIKERLDFSCAVFDEKGNLVANAPHMPVHLGSMGESVKSVINTIGDDLKPGDVYALNNPYNGGTHLPDITVVTPVFDDAGTKIIFYVAARGHHADVGGITPGSMPAFSQSIEEEGVLIDNFLLVKGDNFLEKELKKLLVNCPYPARNPNQNIADLKAQVAACQKGIDELRSLVRHYGLDVVQSFMKHVQDNAEASVRRVLDKLDDGSFRLITDNGDAICVSITVDKAARKATIDFAGTSDQSETNFNAPSAVTRAAILYVFRCLIGEDIPLNDGCLKPLDIKIPKNSLLDPAYPAAVVAGNVETSQAVTDALFGACGVMAAAQGTMNNLTFGNKDHQYYETICGGSGAGDGFDGTDAVHTHMTNSRLTDPEVLEFRFPVMLEAFEIRHDTGGTGKYRGGDGTRRHLHFLEAMDVSLLASRRTTVPFGLEGGESAAPGKDFVIRSNGDKESLKGCDQVTVGTGDHIIIQTPGGGGFGKKQ